MSKIKYFIYSAEQLKLRKELEEKIGRQFVVGHVIVDGEKKPFTELSAKPTSKYSDAKIVAEGDPTLMKFTLPEGKKT